MTSTIDARWAELAPGTVAPLAQHLEFLNTAELPERVQWRDLNRHGRQAHRAVS